MSFHAFGIDPGTSNPGLAWVTINSGHLELVELPVLRSLDELVKTLAAWAKVPKPRSSVAVESVAWGLHSGRSGNGSGRILESVGAARMFAEIIGAQYVTVAPSTWRKTVTGSGKKTKEQVRQELSKRVTGWPAGKVGLNRSDAVAIAIAGCMR